MIAEFTPHLRIQSFPSLDLRFPLCQNDGVFAPENSKCNIFYKKVSKNPLFSKKWRIIVIICYILWFLAE